MAEAIAVGVLAWIALIVMVAILWLFIARWDLIDRLGISEDFPFRRWQIYPRPTQQQKRQQELYVRYIKARHSGTPFDEDEFSALPAYMRSERLRRILYAFIGLAFASLIGAFAGTAVYGFIQHARN